MINSFYFSHDFNARNDPKIKRLFMRHGVTGYGLFWAIIEDLYQNANALPTDYESIAFDLRSDCETVKSVINDFGLFVITENIFHSDSVQRRLDARSEKVEKAKKSAQARWDGKKKDETRECNANALENDANAMLLKEIKEKEIKVNEIKVKNNSEKNEISKNEISTLTSERDFFKSELEKLKSEQTPKKPKKEKAPQAGGAVEKIVHGEFENVFLTLHEAQKLFDEHGSFKFDLIIKRLSIFKEVKGTKYKSDYAAILNWVVRAVNEDAEKERDKNARIFNPNKGFVPPNQSAQPDKYQLATEANKRRLRESINQVSQV